jgi:hypothetical protein
VELGTGRCVVLTAALAWHLVGEPANGSKCNPGLSASHHRQISASVAGWSIIGRTKFTLPDSCGPRGPGAWIQTRLPDALIRRLAGILVIVIRACYLWAGLN